MSCWHYYAAAATTDGDSAFTIDANRVTFGAGALGEVGGEARRLGLSRVALFTDATLAALPHAAAVRAALRAAGVEAEVFSEVRIEPSAASFKAAARFYQGGRFDGAVSLGGGSVMDTAKAALLLATYPVADLETYAGPPLGAGVPVPGPLPPHIACPTTSGTGSECTGIAVCELPERGVKIGVAHRALRPTLALVDPACTATLPAAVVAASGFDVLSHAIESYTALPYTRRPRGAARPMSQGANPFSDLGCLEALRLCGRFLLRAVHDPADREARGQMLYAATLAGLAFGNAGVHVPHAMAYAVGALHPRCQLDGYPPERPLLPHGLSVILSAPAALRFTAAACPERHREAALALGASPADARAAADDPGALLHQQLLRLLRASALPCDLRAVGYGADAIPALAEGTLLQARLLGNAPRAVDRAALLGLFAAALDNGEGAP